MAFSLKKYQKYERIVFYCETVTPMFMSGATGNKFELRPQSIKGLIRFWWRFLNGHKYIDHSKNILSEIMLQDENKIFGSTDEKANFKIFVELPKNIRQKILSNKIKSNYLLEASHKENNENKTIKMDIFDWLLYGCQGVSNYLSENSEFKIYFDFYNNEHKDKILKSFYTLSKYGGLGAKSRNGFGCFRITNAEPEKYLNEYKQYNLDKKNINVGKIKENFFFLNKETFLLETKNDKEKWSDALVEIGGKYYNARKENKHKYEKRKLIGRPIGNYKDRLAKPLFLHIEKKDNGKYKGQILVSPYFCINSNLFDDFVRDLKKDLEEKQI